MKYKVSIVVPVYNGEKPIERCLNSLLKQTLKEIEIICVNDGSTDKTLKVLKKYAADYSNIKVVSQKNGGLSSARNTGIKNASSSYIMFCDGDDVFMPSMCERMVKAMDDERVDVVACGTKVKYKAHSEIAGSDVQYYRIKFIGRHYVNETITSKTDVSVCDKIFRKDLLEKYNICFPEGLNNEDYYFYNAYMSVARTIYFINKKMYSYVRHEGSIMSENFEQNSYSPDHLLVAIKLFSFYKKNHFLKKHLDFFWDQFVESYYFSYLHSAESRRKEIQGIANEFIKINYSSYKPIDSDIRKKVFEIAHDGFWYRAMCSFSRKIKHFYSSINIAYRQQEFINTCIVDTDRRTRGLIDRLNDITEEKNDET